MSNNTTSQPKPSMEVIARIDELEAMLDLKDSNLTEADYEEHANLVRSYDWYDEEFEENGKVVDYKIVYAENFIDQMMEYGRKYATL